MYSGVKSFKTHHPKNVPLCKNLVKYVKTAGNTNIEILVMLKSGVLDSKTFIRE